MRTTAPTRPPRRRRLAASRRLPTRNELFYTPETLLLLSLAQALRMARTAIQAKPGAGFDDEHDTVRPSAAAVTIRHIDGLLRCIRLYRRAVTEQIRHVARDLRSNCSDELPF